MTGVRFDRGGEIGVAGRPLAVEDQQRRQRQRGSNGAAATERRGLREARETIAPCRGSELCRIRSQKKFALGPRWEKILIL